MNQNTKKYFLAGGSFLLLAVILGAFGAHGLKKILDTTALETYKTGVTYQFYHGFGLLFLGLISSITNLELKKSFYAFIFGIFLFSFNCYLYSVTQIKVIALIIPIGGVLFILGWLNFIIQVLKSEKK